MTRTRRWRSSRVPGIHPGTFQRLGWWLALGSISLLVLSPIVSQGISFSALAPDFVAHLFFPLILWTWVEGHPLRGIGVVIWASLLVGIVALALREFPMLLLPACFIGLGWCAHRGIQRWQDAHRADLLLEEKIQEQINTFEGELKNLADLQEASQERVHRYEQLQQIANTFSATLSREELLSRIVRATGEVLPTADRVLLYLVDPQSLTLELRSVWRRNGQATIKAKTGDPFDFWVMRQGQPLLVEDTRTDFRFPSGAFHGWGRQMGSLLAVPLVDEVRLVGILRVESASHHRFGDPELRLTRIVGDLASLSIENSRLYQQWLTLANTDDLTGLSVRTYFEKVLQDGLRHARQKKAPLSLLLIDIDDFKVYNDTFGHSAGDKLLRQLAGLLTQLSRPGEMAARLGGEEFVLLFPGVEREEAARRAEEIRGKVEQQPIELRRTWTKTTVSIGVATFPRDGQLPEELLKVADQRLYRAKGMGRNQVCFA